jgi:ParB-like chromosome segregation protein Spo0J
MKVVSVPIDSISPDPANARTHDERNLTAIAASLRRFGQQKPLVVDGKGVIRAGSGTYLAARERLGWDRIAVVRTELEGSEATAYALADNRAGDLGGFDDTALAAQLEALGAEGFDLVELGWNADELDALSAAAAAALDEPAPAGASAPDEPPGEELLPERWMLVVDCRDEAEQVRLLARFQAEGLAVQAIIG